MGSSDASIGVLLLQLLKYMQMGSGN